MTRVGVFLSFLLVINVSYAEECKPFDSCTVTFYELIPSPKKYENSIIRIVGVAKSFENEWFLFASADAAKFLLFEQSISFSVESEDIKEPFEDGDYVYLQGVFNSEYKGKRQFVKGVVDSESKATLLVE
jgi:hypothetical protein